MQIDEQSSVPGGVLFVDEEGNPIEAGHENLLYVDEAGNEIPEEIAYQLIESGKYVDSRFEDIQSGYQSQRSYSASGFGSISKANQQEYQAELSRRASSQALYQADNESLIEAQTRLFAKTQAELKKREEELASIEADATRETATPKPLPKPNSSSTELQIQKSQSGRRLLQPPPKKNEKPVEKLSSKLDSTKPKESKSSKKYDEATKKQLEIERKINEQREHQLLKEKLLKKQQEILEQSFQERLSRAGTDGEEYQPSRHTANSFVSQNEELELLEKVASNLNLNKTVDDNKSVDLNASIRTASRAVSRQENEEKKLSEENKEEKKEGEAKTDVEKKEVEGEEEKKEGEEEVKDEEKEEEEKEEEEKEEEIKETEEERKEREAREKIEKFYENYKVGYTRFAGYLSGDKIIKDITEVDYDEINQFYQRAHQHEYVYLSELKNGPVDPFDPCLFNDEIVDIDFGAIDAYTSILNAQVNAQVSLSQAYDDKFQFPPHVLTSNYAMFIDNQLILGEPTYKSNDLSSADAKKFMYNSNDIDVQFFKPNYRTVNQEKDKNKSTDKENDLSRSNSFGSIVDVENQQTFSVGTLTQEHEKHIQKLKEKQESKKKEKEEKGKKNDTKLEKKEEKEEQQFEYLEEPEHSYNNSYNYNYNYYNNQPNNYSSAYNNTSYNNYSANNYSSNNYTSNNYSSNNYTNNNNTYNSTNDYNYSNNYNNNNTNNNYQATTTSYKTSNLDFYHDVMSNLNKQSTNDDYAHYK